MSDESRGWTVARHAFTALGLLATVVACYWAADQIDLLPAFWALLLIAMAYGLARVFGPIAVARFKERRMRLRDYERVKRAAGVAIAERDDLSKDLQELKLTTQDAARDALLRGRRRVVGELQAAAAAAELSIVHCEISDDELLVVAHVRSGAVPAVGSRYYLKLVEGVRVKAAFTVSDTVTERRNIVLTLTDIFDSAFIHGFRERAAQGVDPPSGTVLVGRTARDLNDLERELED